MKVKPVIGMKGFLAGGAVLALFLFGGCSKKEEPAAVVAEPVVELPGAAAMEQAAAGIATSIDKQFDAGTKIALINIASVDQRAVGVLNDMAAYLAKGGKLGVVDSEKIDLACNELNIKRHTPNGLSDASLLSLGRALGAQMVLTGTMGVESDAYHIAVRILEVQTSEIAGHYQATVPVGKPANLL